MKKVFILLLAVVALLAFSIPAMALHGVKEMLDYTPSTVKAKSAQVTLSGDWRVRGSYCENCSDFQDETAGSFDDDAAAYDHRVRLGVMATVSPNTFGVLQLENDSLGSDGFTWGAVQAGGGTYNQSGNAKPTDMHIRQSYISHQGTALTGMLSGFKVGHMLIALGTGTYYNHTKGGDDTILFWVQPNDDTEIAFAIIKGDENSSSGTGINSDDTDIYAITLETKAGGAAISADVSRLHDDTTFNQGTGVDANLDLWNLGLRVGLDLSGVGVNVGCDIQSGEIENYKTSGNATLDLSGYQCQIKADTMVGDVNVHAGFAYGSGDDIDSTDDYEGFITSLSSGGNIGTFVYDNTLATAGQTPSATGVSSTWNNANTQGLANTWYLNVGATTNVTPDVAVNAELFFLNASEKVSNTAELDDETVGVELDGKVTYQIDTALAWYVETGILFADDFYKNVTGAGVSPDSAWRVRQGVTLSF